MRTDSEAVLQSALGHEGVLGAALVGRDGLPIVEALGRASNPDAVCAMAAAILGAGDAALLDMVGQEASHFEVSSRGCRLLGHGVDDQYLALLVTEAGVDGSSAARILDEAVSALRGIVA